MADDETPRLFNLSRTAVWIFRSCPLRPGTAIISDTSRTAAVALMGGKRAVAEGDFIEGAFATMSRLNTREEPLTSCAALKTSDYDRTLDDLPQREAT
jgi:hypothetical protein